MRLGIGYESTTSPRLRPGLHTRQIYVGRASPIIVPGSLGRIRSLYLSMSAPDLEHFLASLTKAGIGNSSE